MTLLLTTMPFLLMAARDAAPIIDNEQVRVSLITAGPHAKGSAHEHSAGCVLISLGAGRDKSGGRGAPARRAGEVQWVPAGGSHSIESGGSNPYRVVEVELKQQGRAVETPALDPLKVAPQSYRVVMDNPQARVLHVRIAPRLKVPMHEHMLNRVVVFLTDHRFRVVDESGQVRESTGKAGDVRFFGAAKHSEENLSDSPIEVVVVEAK